MPKVKVFDLLKEVEYNRKSLIKHCNENGINVSPNASLSTVVYNTINNKNTDLFHEVTFYDADGTVLSKQYIPDGGTCVPPENPNIDSANLTFLDWTSAIGNQFDNIKHPVDYIAKYQINDGGNHLFCNFTEETGKSVTIKFNIWNTISRMLLLNIDWGDGTTFEQTETGTYTFTHEYEDYGSYEIKLIGNIPQHYGANMYWSLEAGTVLGSEQADLALDHGYYPFIKETNFKNNYNQKWVIIDESYYSDSNGIYNCGVYAPYRGTWKYPYFTKPTIVIWNNVVKAASIPSNIHLIGSTQNHFIIPAHVSITTDKSLKYTVSSPRMYIKELYILGDCDTSSISLTGLQKIVIMGKCLQAFTINSQYIKSLNYSTEYIITLNSKCILNNTIAYIVPRTVTSINTAAFTEAYFLKDLHLYEDFILKLDLSTNYNITTECLLDILNKVKNLSDTTTQTLTLFSSVFNSCKNTKVSLLGSQYVLDTNGNLTLLEAFNNKNWTVAQGSY